MSHQETELPQQEERDRTVQKEQEQEGMQHERERPHETQEMASHMIQGRTHAALLSSGKRAHTAIMKNSAFNENFERLTRSMQ